MKAARGSSPEDLARLITQAESDTIASASEAGDTEQLVPIVAFRNGTLWFGCHVETIREVVVYDDVTAVPSLPEHFLGIRLSHGRIIPVIDLMRILGTSQERQPATTAPRLLILQSNNVLFAIVAEETRGVLRLPIADEGGSLMCRQRLHWGSEVINVLDTSAVVDVVSPEA